MRSFHTSEMLRKVRFHNRWSKVDWFRVCKLQVLVVGNLKIDFTPHLEYAQFVTRSPRQSSSKRKGKMAATTEIAATHLNQSWKEKHHQVSMEADQSCRKRRIQYTGVIMRFLRHLRRLTMLHHSKSRNLTVPQLLAIHPISNSHSSSKTHPSRTRIKTRMQIQRLW